MKNTCFIISIIFQFSVLGYSSNSNIQVNKSIQKNISYRSIPENDTDTYKKTICKLDISYPINRSNLPTVIFLHGGGLYTGDKYFPAQFADQNIIVVSPDYRLSPPAKCPSYIEDAAAATAWVFNHISEYGGNPKKIFLSGYSAGAYLASMVFLDKKYLNLYKIDPDSLAGFYSFSGQMTTHFTVLGESGIIVDSDTKTVDQYAPLFYVRKTICPVILYTGDSILDMAGRYAQNIEMRNELQSLGNNRVKYIKFNGHNHATFLDLAVSNAIEFTNMYNIILDSIQGNRLVSNNIQYIDSLINVSVNGSDVNIKSDYNLYIVELYDISGKKLIKINISNTKFYSFSTLNIPKGIYLLKVTTSNGMCSHKISIYSSHY
jgi:acetyl esterase/lipase